MTAGRSSGARAPASISTGFRCAVQKWLPHSFKTEQVHLHHCIPSMCRTQSSIFFVYHKSCAHGFKTERVHLHHCIPPMCGTQWSIFFWTAKADNFVPHIGGMQWCRCTGPVLNLCANLICGFEKKNEYQKMDDSVPHLRGMQWCRCTRSVLKLCT